MIHPKDWPTVPCPQCGKGSLLTYGIVACEVIDCPGPAVRMYGYERNGIVTPGAPEG
jgi:hypothetical protein